MMDAVVISGGRPGPEDPLYPFTLGKPKALLEVGGRPMLDWVLDALSEAESVRRIFVIGLTEEEARAQSKWAATWLPDQGSMLANIREGLAALRREHPGSERALLVSADIPAITPDVVDWRVEAAQAAPADIDYSVVSRATMEARFPGVQRSYVRLRDVEVCGGDINVIRTDLVENQALWERLIAARKSARRQAALLGLDLLLLLLTRRMSLAEAERRASARLGLRGRATLSPYAEVAMDLDKPAHLAILEDHLSARTQHG